MRTLTSAEPKIKVNQIGYLPKGKKVAIVTGMADLTFKLIDLRTGNTIKTGQSGSLVFDPNSGDEVGYIDFSDVIEEGTYQLEVEEIGTSYPFLINEKVYHDALVKTGRSYTLQRSNTVIDDPITGLRLNAGFSQDKEAQMFFTDAFYHEGDKLAVEGGWYDAGDYGKYIPPAAVTVAQFLLAYELHPTVFTKGQFLFPEGVLDTENLPDVLEEVKFELDWMRKMQRPDGAVYHKVSGKNWTGWVIPEEDTQTRFVYGMSTYGTAMFAAAMAQASRVFKLYDKTYAEKLLTHAIMAQEYLQANPETEFRFDPGQDNGSGPYGKRTDRDDRFWAAAELLKTTHDKKYEDYLQGHFADLFAEKPSFVSWGNTLALAQWAYATTKNGDSQVKAEIKKAFIMTADEILRQVEKDGYFCALEAKDYTWASNKNAAAKGNLLLMANELSENEEYITAALEQLHYLLGRNAMDMCFLTGTGSNPVLHPHNRICGSTNIIIPGLLVGGPNHFGGDPDIEAFVKETHPPHAKSYLDYFNSWAVNENAIDYNAAVFFLLAYFNAEVF